MNQILIYNHEETVKKIKQIGQEIIDEAEVIASSIIFPQIITFTAQIGAETFHLSFSAESSCKGVLK